MTETHSMIIEGGNDALRLDINVDRHGKPVKVWDHRNPVRASIEHYLKHSILITLKGWSIQC